MKSLITTLSIALVSVGIGFLGGALLCRPSAKPAVIPEGTFVITGKVDTNSRALLSLNLASPSGTENADLSEQFMQPLQFRNGALILGWVLPKQAPNTTE